MYYHLPLDVTTDWTHVFQKGEENVKKKKKDKNVKTPVNSAVPISTAVMKIEKGNACMKLVYKA